MDSQDPVRTTLFSTLSGGMDIPPYRIPGITCGKDGRLYASAARLVCGTDPGYGQVDCVVKISNDNGTTWSSQEIDVAVQLGRIDDACALEVQFDIAGHGGRHGPEGDAFHLLRPADGRLALLPIVQGPFSVEGKGLCPGSLSEKQDREHQ